MYKRERQRGELGECITELLRMTVERQVKEALGSMQVGKLLAKLVIIKAE